MQQLKLSVSFIFFTIILLLSSCNNAANKNNENTIAQTSSGDTTQSINSSTTNNSIQQTDTSASVQSNNDDSTLTQMKNLASMFGNNDSGVLKNFSGAGNDSMMKILQSMMSNKNGSPGDAIANSILNLQLGQMKDNNPLKQVANEMMKAQQNGTAGPSKTYSAVYTPEQPSNYNVPVSGNGNTIMLQYTGGSITNNKKDGLWKNLYISMNTANKWNVYSEGYAESSALNMKVHSTSLSDKNENYYIIINDQYKKYFNQYRNESGQNESGVQVQKIGDEKMFGYNCVHIKISYTIKALGQTANSQDDEWYSADVPGASFLSPVIFENHSPVVVNKMIATGCTGALVKSISKSSGISQVIQLSSVTKKNMPDSRFSLPSGYEEDKNIALYDLQ